MFAQLPSEKRPIYIIGAGGIVNDAHLPAYKIVGYNVGGILISMKQKQKKQQSLFQYPIHFQV
jgi:hypothetical protein